MEVSIKILNEKIKDFLPQYQTDGSAGLDLRACIDKELVIKAGETSLIGTGISMHIKNNNYAGLIIPRSGLGSKHGIVLSNLVGLIDSDYQGEMMIPIWNRSNNDFIIKELERIAQLIIFPILKINFHIVDEFEKTERGTNGFGSTGK